MLRENKMNDILIVQGSEIRTFEKHSEQFICITDIAKRFGSSDLINDWLKNKNTVDFLASGSDLITPNLMTLSSKK